MDPNNTTDLTEIMRQVARDEAESQARKMGISYDDLIALRRHPDKAWARAEAKRLLTAPRKPRWLDRAAKDLTGAVKS